MIQIMAIYRQQMRECSMVSRDYKSLHILQCPSLPTFLYQAPIGRPPATVS